MLALAMFGLVGWIGRGRIVGGRDVIQVGVHSLPDSLDFALFRHPAEQHIQGITLHAGLLHEGRNRHGQACLFERGNDLGPLRRDVNLGRVAEQAPTARLMASSADSTSRPRMSSTAPFGVLAMTKIASTAPEIPYEPDTVSMRSSAAIFRV